MTDHEHQQAMYDILFTIMTASMDCSCEPEEAKVGPVCDCSVRGSDLIQNLSSLMHRLEAKGCS